MPNSNDDFRRDLKGHIWVMHWPGNFCLKCHMDDPFETCLALHLQQPIDEDGMPSCGPGFCPECEEIPECPGKED